MKKLMIAFGLMMWAVLPAQAQYQDLVDQKITQLVKLQQQLVTVPMPAVERDEALDLLADNLVELIDNRDTVEIQRLRELEQEINQVAANLAARVLGFKKIKLQEKLDELAQVITERELSGQPTEKLKTLWEEMANRLENL